MFDILGDLCFGKSFDMKERDSDMKYVPHLMAEFVALMHPVCRSPHSVMKTRTVSLGIMFGLLS